MKAPTFTSKLQPAYQLQLVTGMRKLIMLSTKSTPLQHPTTLKWFYLSPSIFNIHYVVFVPPQLFMCLIHWKLIHNLLFFSSWNIHIHAMIIYIVSMFLPFSILSLSYSFMNSSKHHSLPILNTVAFIFGHLQYSMLCWPIPEILIFYKNSLSLCDLHKWYILYFESILRWKRYSWECSVMTNFLDEESFHWK